MTTNLDSLIDFYRIFLRIRRVEERIAREYPAGEIRCPVHLSIGQEVVSAAFAITQGKSDYAVSTHRAHAHYLAKGGDLKKMIAEIYGKVTGCSRGRGGSMHLVDISVGFIGSSAIVGNSIPVGVGIAHAQQLKGNQAVTYIFLGDGAVEEGSFYESANFAVLKNLPVIFVCENNLYSVYTQLSERQSDERSISDVARSLGLAVQIGDGTNPSECISIFQKARAEVDSARKPQFIEFQTYRWLEHCGPNDDDQLGYRPLNELTIWKAKDSLSALREDLLSTKGFSLKKILGIENAINDEIEEAFELAKTDAYPVLDEILDSTYAR